MFRLIDKLAGAWFNWRTTRMARANGFDPLSDVEIKEVFARPGHIDVTFEARELVYIGSLMSTLLEGFGAENFVEMDFMSRPDHGGRNMRLLVQVADGLSPAQKCQILQKRVDELEKMLGECNAEP